MTGGVPRKDVQKFREIWWHGLSIDMRALVRQSKETYDCADRRKPGGMVAASMESYYGPLERSAQDLINAAFRLRRSVEKAKRKERELRRKPEPNEE